MHGATAPLAGKRRKGTGPYGGLSPSHTSHVYSPPPPSSIGAPIWKRGCRLRICQMPWGSRVKAVARHGPLAAPDVLGRSERSVVVGRGPCASSPLVLWTGMCPPVGRPDTRARRDTKTALALVWWLNVWQHGLGPRDTTCTVSGLGEYEEPWLVVGYRTSAQGGIKPGPGATADTRLRANWSHGSRENRRGMSKNSPSPLTKTVGA